MAEQNSEQRARASKAVTISERLVDGGIMDVDEYMILPYRKEIYLDGDTWAAEFPELPGLVAGHETLDGLLAAIQDAKRAYFTAALEMGQVIPLPRGE